MEIETLIIGIIFMIIFYIIKRPRVGINEPPLVPYTIPILGHTLDYLFNSKNFIKKCKAQYGECFSIYVYGDLMTILSGTSINDMFRSHEDFDMTTAAAEILPQNKIFVYNGGITKENVKFHANTTREHITSNLGFNIPIVQKYLSKGIDEWIGDCNDPKLISNGWTVINKIIALPIANVFVGEEAASHKDLVSSFESLAFDLGPLMVIPPILGFIHKKLHEFAISVPLRFGWSPVSHHRKVTINRLRPVIEKRLKERESLGDNYKPYKDLLEYYMSKPDFDNKFLKYVDHLFSMVFAAIATTSRASTNALFDLAGRPECLNELYEEALMINKECNGSLTLSDVKRMKKLDSFVKESIRHSDDIISLPHYMTSKSYTFSNGYTISEGRKVFVYSDDSLKSKVTYGDDAEEFKPFRFVNENSPATKVDRSYVIFGGGKHACPGRFFAVNETKMILYNLILRYDISTKSGKIENKLIIGPFTLPSRSTLVFKKRK